MLRHCKIAQRNEILPEEKLSGLIGCLRDRQKSRIGFTNVKVDVRDFGAIDNEF